MKEKMLWATDGNSFVNASKLRVFTLSPREDGQGWEVNGWFDKDECFPFGDFLSEGEAVKFFTKLYRQMEGGE